jgi:hypothetical protein
VDVTVGVMGGFRCCTGDMGGAVGVVTLSCLWWARHGGCWTLDIASVGWEDQCGLCVE